MLPHPALRRTALAGPPADYASRKLTESEAILDSVKFPLDSRTEEAQTLQLENERLCARFDQKTCALVSLVDKGSGDELVDPHRPAVFRKILEDDGQGMTAWVVGRYMKIEDLTEGVRLLKLEKAGPLRQSLTYEVSSGASRLIGDGIPGCRQP